MKDGVSAGVGVGVNSEVEGGSDTSGWLELRISIGTSDGAGADVPASGMVGSDMDDGTKKVLQRLIVQICIVQGSTWDAPYIYGHDELDG